MLRSVSVLLAVGLLPGCNLEDSVGGLADSLLDPEPSSLESPGRQIVKGSYSNLELDASLAVGARLLALRHDRDISELAIIPFEGGEACHVGPASRFMRLASQIDVDLTPMVGYLDQVQDNRGTLHFVDFDCREVMPELQDVGMPQVLYPRSAPTGFLTLSGRGSVHFVNVVEPAVSTVAENVRSGRVGTQHLWVIEEGVLIALDDDFEAVAHFGQNVSEFALFSGLIEQGVTDAAYVEDGKLWLVTGTDGEPVELAEDACQVTDIGHSGAFAFYSPCATRRLGLAYKSRLLGLDEDEILVTRLSEQALDPRQVDLFWGQDYGAAVYVTGEDANAQSGRLLFQAFSTQPDGSEAAEELHENGHVATGGTVLVNYHDGVGSLANLIVETNDVGRPEVVHFEPFADNVAQLPGVTVSSSLGVLVDYDSDSGTGNLVTFSHDLEEPPKTLVAGVPIQRHARDNIRQRSAFVGDFDGSTGTVYVMDAAKTRALGDGALPGTLKFVELPEAVGYLAAPADALTLYLLGSDLETVINEHVNEFHSLPWPSPGMLYSVSEGADQGLWFARAR